MLADAFIPEDRRAALAAGRTLPTRTCGAALFADISGFTPLTAALARALGPRRGAEVLTQQLNLVYSALIDAVERWGGSVIGFSGDAITCWFDEGEQDTSLGRNATAQRREGEPDSSQGRGPSSQGREPLRGAPAAVACALAMQTAMTGFAQVALADGVEARLALKTAVVSGAASRLLVGEPRIQLIDVLAGSLLDTLAEAEHAAQQGDVVVDLATLAALGGEYPVRERRRGEHGHELAVLAPVRHGAPAEPPALELPTALPTALPSLPDSLSRQWVLAPVHARLRSEGERFLAELRPATVLFLQFGGLDFDGDPQAGAVLDAFVRWVQGVVDAYAGAVIQLTTGDKGSYLYASFGAPVSGDEDAQRAVATALTLRNPPPHLAAIGGIRIGISQGMMRAGPYGGERRITYGVLGDATNLAARLMTEAEVHQVYVNAGVAEAVAGRYELQALGLRSFKGKSEPQPIFAVTGAAQQAALLGGEVGGPLLGRQAELARLIERARAAAEGTGCVLRLEGEAGVGKSRLAAHFAAAASEIGLRVIVAGCQSTAQNRAYFAAEQLVCGLLDLPPSRRGAGSQGQGDQAELAAEIEQVRRLLAEGDPDWLLRLPLLGDLLGLPIPDNPTTAAFDARLRQEALADLVTDITRRAARLRPLLVVVEDAHWLDEASRALVLALAQAVPSLPCLLLLVQRPPENDRHALEQELAGLLPAAHDHLRLAELDADGSAALVRERLGGEVGPLALGLTHSLAQGNPFFTEELIDALCEGELLAQDEAGVWRLAPSLIDALQRGGCLLRVGAEWQLAPSAALAAIDIGVPASIHGLVLSRLDRLPEASKLTLKVASVIGRVFELDLLAAAHPHRPASPELAAEFDLLQGRDFARLETPQPRPVYTFKHNITQEVVYQTLLQSQRQELHVAIADALEAQAPQEVERLAHHYGQGDTLLPSVRGKALHYLDAAGHRAAKEHANETALAYFDRALQMEVRRPWLKGRAEALHILGRRSEEEETLSALDALGEADAERQLEGAMLWAQFYTATGNYAQAGAALQRARALAVTLGDRHGQARCHNEGALIDWRQGDYAAAQQGYEAALELSAGDGRLGDPHGGSGDGRSLDVQGEAHYGLGLVYRQQGRYAEARSELEQALAVNRQLGDRRREAQALNALGSVASLERAHAAAAAYFDEALRLRELIGDRAGVGASLMSLAQVYSSLGDYSRVQPLLHQALEIQQAVRNRWEEMLVLNELGILYTAVGQYGQAVDFLRRALDHSREIGSEIGAAYVLCNLGQAQRDAGQLADAACSFEEGLRLAQDQGDLNLEAIYWGDTAALNLREGDLATAADGAAHALALFTQLDLPLSCTSVYGTLAAARLGLGDRAGAGEAVAAALALLENGNESLDYPQRTYWQCAEVLAALGDDDTAARARHQAAALLTQRAGRISDPVMRQSYLMLAALHAEIGGG